MRGHLFYAIKIRIFDFFLNYPRGHSRTFFRSTLFWLPLSRARSAYSRLSKSRPLRARAQLRLIANQEKKSGGQLIVLTFPAIGAARRAWRVCQRAPLCGRVSVFSAAATGTGKKKSKAGACECASDDSARCNTIN